MSRRDWNADRGLNPEGREVVGGVVFLTCAFTVVKGLYVSRSLQGVWIVLAREARSVSTQTQYNATIYDLIILLPPFSPSLLFEFVLLLPTINLPSNRDEMVGFQGLLHCHSGHAYPSQRQPFRNGASRPSATVPVKSLLAKCGSLASFVKRYCTVLQLDSFQHTRNQPWLWKAGPRDRFPAIQHKATGLVPYIYLIKVADLVSVASTIVGKT